MLLLMAGALATLFSSRQSRNRAFVPTHPNPYQISWITDEIDVKVIDSCLVNFSICGKYFDEILCDVEDIDAGHNVA